MNFYFGMGGTPISLRQKLRMQRERMQCAGLWPVVLNVLSGYLLYQFTPYLLIIQVFFPHPNNFL